MPNRIIKESICRSDTIDRLSALEECFFYRLMVQCDDHGRFDGRPPILRGSCFPLKEGISNEIICEMLQSLARAGLIFIYESDGLPYIQIAKWDKHQQVRAKRSKYPDPNGESVVLQSSDINCLQAQAPASKCPRNPIQSNPNPNPIPPCSPPKGDSNPQISKTKHKKKEPISPATEKEFEEVFWPKVWAKVGYGDAKESFAKARKKADLEEIMDGLLRYSAYETARAAQKDYRPLHPSTWLNQERWKDVPPALPTGGQSRVQAATGSHEDYGRYVQGGEDDSRIGDF